MVGTAHLAEITLGCTLYIALACGCGNDALDTVPVVTTDTGHPSVATKTAKELIVSYFSEVLAPSLDTLRIQGTRAWYNDLPYDLEVRSDTAILASTIFFDLGDSTLSSIDSLGLEPFDVYPLCLAASEWVDSLATLDTQTGDDTTVLENIMHAGDATMSLHDAVQAELGSRDDPLRVPPEDRVDHDRCLEEAREGQ
jgi:hypothetical protein